MLETSKNERRHEAFVAVYSWIEEKLDTKAAHDWAWNCTPWPAGLPSEEMLQQGLEVALGVRDLHDLMLQCEEEMVQAMERHQAQELLAVP